MKAADRRTAIWILPVILAAVPSLAQDPYGFPPDPVDEQVIDRVVHRTGWGDDMLIVYAILCDRDGRASVDIQAGTYGMDGVSWEHVYTWDISFNGAPVDVPRIATIDAYSDGDTAFITYLGNLFRGEGLSSLYLEIDLVTMECREAWAD
jgi:hypothetical protein